MSRRRKGQRKQGGRTTPKGGRPGFRPTGGGPAGLPSIGGPGPFDSGAPPSITGLFDPIASLFSPDRDDHPSEIERMACELVGLTQSIAADQPLPGGPASSRPSRITGMAPPGDAEDMLTSAALALAESQQFRPEARYVDCLRPILPFCASSAHAELTRRIDRLESKIGAPLWADAVWNATAIGGWHGWDDLGDLSTIGVELRWPGGWSDQVLFASIIVQEGPFVQEFLVTTIDAYRRVFTPGTPWQPGPNDPPCRADVIRHLESIDVAEAAGLICHAMDITDLMVDAPVADDSYLYTPLARQILGGVPSVEPPEPEPATHNEREELIKDFLNADGVAEQLGYTDDPELAQEVGEFCELFIDYAERYAGGDIHRWSPMVVEGFLHFYGQQVIADDATDEILKPVLSTWIGYCHRLKGWAQSVTDAALAALDEHYGSAVGHNGDDLDNPMLQMIRMAAERGLDLDDPEAIQQLVGDWDDRQAWTTDLVWPAKGAAPMMWDHVPDEAVEQCQAVLAIAEPVLTRLFTPDHLTSARRMTMDLAGTHTQQFLRGRPDVWAAAITYAVAQVHSAFDSMSRLFGFGKKLTPQQLIDAFPTVSKAAMTSKATMVRDWLDADGRGRRRYNRVAASAGPYPFPEHRG